jgi:type 1 glutamine amidotransferase
MMTWEGGTEAMTLRTMPPLWPALFFVGFIWVPPPGPAIESAPIRVLILSGQNNHEWKATTPRLREILERGGRFKVDVAESPGLLTARSLEPYDVILSNWNSFGRGPEGEDWPDETKRAYVDFVRDGKGHAVVHAGGASFPGWKEYGVLTLGTWKNGQTSHGPRHEFPVRIDVPSHPITAGMKTFRIQDELWNRPGIADGAEVLASSYSAPDKEGTGRWEPAVLVGRFGKGRTFTLLLGHDAEAMDNAGFQALLRRGIEWAATGRVAEATGTGVNGWRWEKEGNTSLALVGPAGPLWQFRYGAELDTPYFHPLRTTDGRTLTLDRPPDHLWHHGLWFSWKFINGVNYWELDPKTGRPAGRTTWQNVRVSSRENHTARMSLDLAYEPVGENVPVLTEKRTVEVTAPDKEGVYALDWTGIFTAVREALLDRTPLPGEPGGQVWGGYSGLSLRLARDLGERQVMTSDGQVPEMKDDRYRGRHVAMDYSGLIGGYAVGVAILDHPHNPRSPTPWYVIVSPEMSFFTPALLCYEPMLLRQGARITLRYRVFIHPGRWDAARLRTEHERFSRESPDAK